MAAGLGGPSVSSLFFLHQLFLYDFPLTILPPFNDPFLLAAPDIAVNGQSFQVLIFHIRDLFFGKHRAGFFELVSHLLFVSLFDSLLLLSA